MTFELGPARPDQPLERIFSRRRPRPVLVTTLFALMLAGGTAGYWALAHRYDEGTKVTDVPLLRADPTATRRKPEHPGGMTIPNQDNPLYERERAGVERLLPPPEAPLPPPVPPPPAAPPAVADVPPPPSPPAPLPAIVVTPPPAAPAVPTAPAPAPAAAPVAAAHGGKGFRLQLGAVRSADGAKQEWEKLQRKHPDVLSKLSFTAERVELGERGVFFRIQAGPIPDGAMAERSCAALKQRGVGCILVKP